MPSHRRLILLPEAHDDVRNLLAFSERVWGAEGAAAYAAEIEEALQTIRGNPEIGVERPELDIDLRSLPVGTHMILYYVFPETVEIARVMHQKRDVRRFAID